MLNLFSTQRVLVASEYEVEPGRYLERLSGTGLDLVPDIPEGEDEVPAFGPLGLDPDEVQGFLRFLSIMSPLLLAWQAAEHDPRPRKKAAERLSRSAHRFLALGQWLGPDGDVIYASKRAEVIFWYVAALEHLVATDGVEGLTRRVSQRTAVLIGRGDDERITVEKQVREAYSVRSKVAHGDTPSNTDLQDLAMTMRRITRRAFLRLITLGPSFDVAANCDEALLSRRARERSIEKPLSSTLSRLDRVFKGIG
ncbi:hypothetical protein [Micromonospora sp. NPDC005305]|uniref:hypothetical protein n=1 Tax=Micromonospora sp. NPDC005305 TaxID=3156875 RepID=UPI0033A23C31